MWSDPKNPEIVVGVADASGTTAMHLLRDGDNNGAEEDAHMTAAA
jgi:hypothetical protein